MLCKFFRRHKRRLKLIASYNGLTFTGFHMTIVMTDLEKFTLTVTELNAAGAQVPIGGVPAWISSDDGVAALSVASDGLSAVVSSVRSGSASITVSADGLTAVEYVSVMPSPGVQLVLTASAPEPK